MIEYTVKAEGLEELRAALKRSPRIVAKHQRRAMKKSVMTLERMFKVYPPAPPLSRYQRTGTLGRRWVGRVQPSAQLTRGVLENPTPYAPDVQSDDQAEVHKGVWKTVSQMAKEAEGEITGYHEKAVADAVKEIEGS